jgi:hypothetical protein
VSSFLLVSSNPTTNVCRIRDPARDAFEEARKQCEGIPSPELRQGTDLSALVSVVSEARCKYKSKRQSKARKWLTRLSSTIMVYENTLDMLAQHYLEYVSLAWGAIKFVLRVSVILPPLITAQ